MLDCIRLTVQSNSIISNILLTKPALIDIKEVLRVCGLKMILSEEKETETDGEDE